MTSTARINSITRLRVNSDGQGVRSVIFMQGCPLHCFWCCNPETRVGDDFRTLTMEELYRCLEQDVPYYRFSQGGITFSGGEPLAQARFLQNFIRQYCRDISVDVETSLFVRTEALRPLLPWIHEWNVDFKVCSDRKHRRFTGSSNRLILRNLKLLAESVPAERILVTVPLIPGYNDSGEDLAAMADCLKKLGLYRLELHPYRKFAEEKQQRVGMEPVEVARMTAERLEEIRTFLQERGFVLEGRTGVYGKEKCRYLKKLRQTACEQLQLPVEIVTCTYEGDCIGTCPRCESELKQIAALMNKKEENPYHV